MKKRELGKSNVIKISQETQKESNSEEREKKKKRMEIEKSKINKQTQSA